MADTNHTREHALNSDNHSGEISDAQHGARAGGSSHPIATPNPSGVAGFMSPADKKKIDDVAVPNQVQILQWFHLLPQPGSS